MCLDGWEQLAPLLGGRGRRAEPSPAIAGRVAAAPRPGSLPPGVSYYVRVGVRWLRVGNSFVTITRCSPDWELAVGRGEYDVDVGRRLILCGMPAATIAAVVVVWIALPAFAAKHSAPATPRLGNQSHTQRERLDAERRVAARLKQERVAEARDAARRKHERVAEARYLARQIAAQERVAEARDLARLKQERVAKARDRGCPVHAFRLPADAVAEAAEATHHVGAIPRTAVIVASALATSSAAGERGSEVRVQCGARTARRTVVIDLFYPWMLPSASLSQGTVFVSYFRQRGYLIWEMAH
jgi:hypothetical protein